MSLFIIFKEIFLRVARDFFSSFNKRFKIFPRLRMSNAIMQQLDGDYHRLLGSNEGIKEKFLFSCKHPETVNF